VLIVVYVAGILPVTARRSPVTPVTLAICAGTGVGGGLLMVVLWNFLRSGGPGADTSRVMLLFMGLGALAAAGTTAAGAAAARRARGLDDPLALRKARSRQCLAAGPLTAGTAALMLPLLRASAAVHIAATCPASRPGHCIAASAVWVFLLVAGPVLGLAIGSLAGSVIAAQPPLEPPREPRPGGSRSGGVFVRN